MSANVQVHNYEVIYIRCKHACFTLFSCMITSMTIMPFSTVESADNADLNEAVTKLNLRNEMNAYITRLCKNVIHLLELGAIMVRDRTSLVEKCLTFYNMLLNLKFAGNCMVTHLAMHFITITLDYF